jgi:histidinol-phosphate/aromatic aminotransferase/cobyric acid decarboxylase-like protein
LSKDDNQALAHPREPVYKTVNIYRFSKNYITRTFLPALETYVRSEGRGQFYEQVLRVIVAQENRELFAMVLVDEKWYEIDDTEDYEIALSLFAPEGAAFDHYARRHGGYWRFSRLRDFCYLANPYFPPSDMLEEMRGASDVLLRSYPSSGKVLDGLAAQMFGVDPAVITVGNGAAELIVTLGQVCRPSRVGICVPTFDEYLTRFPGAEVVECSHDDLGFTPELSRLAAVLDHTDTLVVVNPDNPSGQCLDMADLLALLHHAGSRGKRLILDESFVDFADPSHCASLLRQDILEANPQLVVLKSISKSYGVPGIRLGVMATADTALLEQVRLHSPVWNVNSFAEYFLQIIGTYEGAYRSACDDLRRERTRLAHLLSTVANIGVLPSQANYFLCEVGASVTSRALAETLLYEHAILVKDCSTKVGMAGRQFVRIAIRDEADNDYLISALRDTMARCGSLAPPN